VSQRPAPSAPADFKRLGSDLAERAAYLAGVLRAELPPLTPNRNTILQEVMDLNRASANCAQAMRTSNDRNVLQNGFSSVVEVADRLEQDLAANVKPDALPRVVKAWESYAAVEQAIAQILGLAGLPQGPPNAPPANAKDRIAALADKVVAQTDAFLQGFAPTAGIVPEGGFFLGDAEQLRDAADGFRQDVARGLAPTQLAYEFRDVDAAWQQLARRVIRIARGRTGPNIQRALVIGDTCTEIRQLLDNAGNPPGVRTPAMPPEVFVGNGQGNEPQPPAQPVGPVPPTAQPTAPQPPPQQQPVPQPPPPKPPEPQPPKD
jgi:hypothetical protein